MSNTKLPHDEVLSVNHSGKRKYNITRITIHHAVGELSARKICEILQKKSAGASCNYAVGKDGDYCIGVYEENRAWTSSSSDNDNRAVTIETACEHKTGMCIVSDVTYNALIELVADICRRNGKRKITWLGDKEKTLKYKPAADEIVLTVHKWFSATDCPGDFLMNHMGEIARIVNEKLGLSTVPLPLPSDDLFKVQVGAYKKKSNAEAMRDKMRNMGYAVYMFSENDLWKVQVGAYRVKQNAINLRNDLVSKGIQAFVTGVA